MTPKTVAESALVLSQRLGPQDVNMMGNVHGGVILKLIDTTAGTVAMRHCRGNAVTASIEHTDFLQPVYVDELITIKASLHYTGRTSMYVGVRVEAEDVLTGAVRHTNSAYLTFVHLDKDRRPTPVPPLKLETTRDHARFEAAKQHLARYKQIKNQKEKKEQG